MPPLRRLTPVLALLCGACVFRSGPTPPAPAVTGAEIQQLRMRGAAASLRLREAIDERDTVGVVTSLSPHVQLVTPDGDTIRGREPAARFLLDLANAPTAPLRIFGGIIQPCREGEIREFDGHYNAPPRPEAWQTNFRAGHVVIAWEPGDTIPTASRIDLAVPRAVARHPGCQILQVTEAPRHRRVATLGVEVSPGQLPRVAAVRDAMTRQGLTLTAANGDKGESFPRTPMVPLGVVVGLRHRTHAVWSAELQAGMRVPEIVEGVEGQTYRRIVVKTLPITLTPLLQYNRGLLRMSAGPGLLVQRRSMRETHERVQYGARATWLKMSDSTYATRDHSVAAGVASQVAVLVPMWYRQLVELHLGATYFGSTAVPATPSFGGARAPNASLTAGLSMGRGW